MTIRGRTIDDAAGEAFDKVAKLMGLGYPGGPAIQKIVEQCDTSPVTLPRPMIHKGYNFSFSGLKTATKVAYEKILEGHAGYSIADLAAGFQESVVDVLKHKSFRLIQETKLQNLVVTGGVAANKKLKQVFESEGNENNISVIFPPPQLCTDNAAMVAGLAYHLNAKGVTGSLDLNPRANILPRGIGK
jgi:N6-L-threonylcarbamoyladenine synthase